MMYLRLGELRRLVKEAVDELSIVHSRLGERTLIVYALSSGANTGEKHDSHWDSPGFSLPQGSSKGDVVGSVTIRQNDMGEWQGKNLYVHESYRRQGIASRMYAYAERELHTKLVPDDELTTDGSTFWRHR